jgi:PUA domain protein
MNYLSNKEKKEISKKFLVEISKKDIFTYEKIQDCVLLYKKNGEKILLKIKKNLFFHLAYLNKENNNYSKILVDNGAVAFMVKGADLMMPGISSFENFEKDEIVIVENKDFPKPLAIGITLFSSNELKNKKSGKVVKIIHYLKDEFY